MGRLISRTGGAINTRGGGVLSRLLVTEALRGKSNDEEMKDASKASGNSDGGEKKSGDESMAIGKRKRVMAGPIVFGMKRGSRPSDEDGGG
jgi:hypothetical protein